MKNFNFRNFNFKSNFNFMYKYTVLNNLYKLPILSIFVLISILIFNLYTHLNKLKHYNLLKIETFKVKNLNEAYLQQKKHLQALKKKYFYFNNLLKEKIFPYTPKEAIRFLLSQNNILVLRYKYKVLKANIPYKIVKVNLDFLTNYKNLKNYLKILKKSNFYILDINLKSHKYHLKDKYTIYCKLKLAFYKKIENKNLINNEGFLENDSKK